MGLEQIEDHPWKSRFMVSGIVLVLAFIGVIITQVRKDGGWDYWLFMAPTFAILSFGLSLYHRRKKWSRAVATIWHEIFHWLGLFLAVYLVSFFVQVGLVGRFIASLQILTLLAFGTFLAGVYIEITFLVIGIVLGLLAASIALFEAYVYNIMIPVILLGLLILFWMAKKHRVKT